MWLFLLNFRPTRWNKCLNFSIALFTHCLWPPLLVTACMFHECETAFVSVFVHVERLLFPMLLLNEIFFMLPRSEKYNNKDVFWFKCWIVLLPFFSRQSHFCFNNSMHSSRHGLYEFVQNLMAYDLTMFTKLLVLCHRAPNIGLRSDDCEESPSQSRRFGLQVA